MTGLPFKADIFRRDRFKHQFPAARIHREIVCCGIPVAAHVAVFKRDPDSFRCGEFRQRHPNLLEPFHGFGNFLTGQRTGEAGDEVRMKQVRTLDRMFETITGQLCLFGIHQRIAEYADAGNLDVFSFQFRHYFFRKFLRRESLVIAVRIGQRKTFKTMWNDLADIVTRSRFCTHHCTDSDILHARSILLLLKIPHRQ